MIGRGNAAAGTKIGILTVGWLAPMEALEHLTAMGGGAAARPMLVSPMAPPTYPIGSSVQLAVMARRIRATAVVGARVTKGM